MAIAVRYFSKSGRTEKVAKAIGDAVCGDVKSITAEPALTEKADVLFLGGAPYANIMAPELKKYAEGVKADQVGTAVLFTTSNWSRRTVRALKGILEGKGIQVYEDTFYANAAKVNEKLDDAKAFAKKAVETIG